MVNDKIVNVFMKAIKGFKLRPLGSEYILIGESVELVNFNKMITMNESAAYLWKQVQELPSFDEAKLTELLLAEYEVSPEQAAHDARETAQRWLDAGIVEN